MDRGVVSCNQLFIVTCQCDTTNIVYSNSVLCFESFNEVSYYCFYYDLFLLIVVQCKENAKTIFYKLSHTMIFVINWITSEIFLSK